MNLLGYNVFESALSEINFDRRFIINTINPHSYIIAKSDKVFKNSLKTCDILLPDGIGIVLAARFLNKKKIKKIAGADIHQYLLEQANIKSLKVFYIGSSDNTLQRIEKKVMKEFNNILVGRFSPPFKEEFDDLDNLKMLETINKFQPDILFVGMTAPKQEKWVSINKNDISASIIVSIGAVFDFYAGTVQRSHPIWIKIGLEWLPRLLKEPRRLWKRNFISTPQFLWDVFKDKIR